MTFTDEHWDCVKQRAVPILYRECVEACVNALEDAKKARTTAQIAVANAQAEALKNDTPENREAILDANTVLQDCARAFDEAQQKLQYVNSDAGKFDMFRDNWATLGDGDKLGAWCAAKELEIKERDLAKKKTAMAELEAEIAKLKA